MGSGATDGIRQYAEQAESIDKARQHLKIAIDSDQEFKGKELEGTEYEQLIDYVSVDKKAFYVVTGDFVSTEDGSGIVHIAPAFGQDDYELSKKYDLPMLQPVTRGGLFTEDIQKRNYCSLISFQLAS